MNKYGLLTKFTTKENKRDELASLLLVVSKSISAKGLYHYIICNDLENHHCVCVNEIWESKTDHENSLENEGNKEVIAKALTLLEGKPESTEFDVLGGKGIG